MTTFRLTLLIILLSTSTLQAQQQTTHQPDTSRLMSYYYEIGPSILASITQLKMNGDYEVFSAGFGVGLSLKRINQRAKAYGNVPWEIGLYMSPRFSQGESKNSGVLSIGLHSTIFEAFGIGIGVNVWKSGQGLVKAHKEDVFFTIGYSITGELRSRSNE